MFRSYSSWKTKMEQDDWMHSLDSPGPFQASGSCRFSLGSGFSSSFGLSGVSLDSAAGESRQNITIREFLRQHLRRVRTTRAGTPQGHDVQREELGASPSRMCLREVPLKIHPQTLHCLAIVSPVTHRMTHKDTGL